MSAGRQKVIIGVTGTIRSGKTEACRHLEKAGYYVIDVDEFAHKLYKKGNRLWNILKNEYGSVILSKTGEIDRETLAEIVFETKKKYRTFASLIFPFLNDMLLRYIKKLKKRVIVLDMAVLFESGFYKYADFILIIRVNNSIWIKRMKKRQNIEKAKKIMGFQNIFSISKKIALSDIVIYNDKSNRELGKNIKRAVENLLRR